MFKWSRRDLLKAGSLFPLLSTGCISESRVAGQQQVIDLAAEPLDTIKVGFIGVGQRGVSHVRQLNAMDGVEIVAICDTDQEVLNRSIDIVLSSGEARPYTYTGSELVYKEMLALDDLDIVVISTPWRWHASMAIDSMLAGKHAFVEVPLAMTVEECWDIVDTAERTQRHCMMLENVCYGRDELMVFNMVQNGVFGELLHGEAAYIHELRWQMKDINRKTGSWRTTWHELVNGNLYPTHGLGPVAQYMGINRGDRFDYLTSVSSPSLGRSKYASRVFPKGHERNQRKYINGDINTSIIKTVRGLSIMIQHDTTTPRPYTRHNLIQGTNGVYSGFPNKIAVEKGGRLGFHSWDYDIDWWREKYEHKFWVAMLEQAKQAGGHGGMDFMMWWRIVHCLRNGKSMDQSVYDAASWSVVAPLSFASVANRSESVSFPDFTRGGWKDAAKLTLS